MSVSRCARGDTRARHGAYWWTPRPYRMADPKPEGTLSAQELCEITGLTDRHHRRISAAGHFPPPILGRYQVGKTLLGIIRYQRELIQRKSNKLAKEQVALTKARRETAQEELAVLRGEYVEKALIGPALRNISLHQRAVLQRILEQEIGPNLGGLTPIEAVEKMKGAVDTICSVFREGVGGWMDKPPEPEAAEPNTPPAIDSLQSTPTNANHQDAKPENS